MAYDFYVVEGKKLIDYKPKASHYERAIIRFLNNYGDSILDKEAAMKYIFLNLKKIVLERRDEKQCTYKELNNRLQHMFLLTDLMSVLTPNEFIRMFPIPKEYDGERYSMKDYFSTIKEVRKYKPDEPIGQENINKFLAEYYNWDVMEFEVAKLSTISDIRRMEGQKDLLEEFAEKNGVELQTFYQEGDYMVDRETGERFKIQKPKSKLRKLFTVV